jgi:hypothetical protein
MTDSENVNEALFLCFLRDGPPKDVMMMMVMMIIVMVTMMMMV